MTESPAAAFSPAPRMKYWKFAAVSTGFLLLAGPPMPTQSQHGSLSTHYWLLNLAHAHFSLKVTTTDKQDMDFFKHKPCNCVRPEAGYAKDRCKGALRKMNGASRVGQLTEAGICRLGLPSMLAQGQQAVCHAHSQHAAVRGQRHRQDGRGIARGMCHPHPVQLMHLRPRSAQDKGLCMQRSGSSSMH